MRERERERERERKNGREMDREGERERKRDREIKRGIKEDVSKMRLKLFLLYSLDLGLWFLRLKKKLTVKTVLSLVTQAILSLGEIEEERVRMGE